MRRREMLYTLGIAAVAGCSEQGSGASGETEGEGNGNTTPSTESGRNATTTSELTTDQPTTTTQTTTTTEPEPSTPGTSGEWNEIINDDTNVHEGSYQPYSFSPDSRAEVRYEFTVTGGPAIDVYVLNDDELANFQTYKRFYPEAESESTDGETQTHELEAGEYHLVFDNSGRGTAEPPEDNSVDDVARIDVTASYLEQE